MHCMFSCAVYEWDVPQEHPSLACAFPRELRTERERKLQQASAGISGRHGGRGLDQMQEGFWSLQTWCTLTSQNFSWSQIRCFVSVTYGVPKIMESLGKICGHGKSWKITKISKVMEKQKICPNSHSKYSPRYGSFHNCPVLNFSRKISKNPNHGNNHGKLLILHSFAFKI